MKPTKARLAEWEKWLADPAHAPVADVARRYPPWKVYWLTSAPPQRVTINSYHDILVGDRKGQVVVNVNVGSYFNCVGVERNVFDVPYEHLVECDDLRPWQEMPQEEP